MRNQIGAWAGFLLTMAPILSLANSNASPSCREGDERHIAFSTSTASGINLDVSPNGKTLVFDILGDLYIAPVKGGHATRITNGPARDVRPVWSPDGKKIAFISDREGDADAPYVMDLGRGHAIRRLARGIASVAGADGKEDLTHLEWMPDSSVIVLHNFMGYKISLEDSGADVVTEIEGSRLDRYYGNGTSLYRFSKDKSHATSDATIGIGNERVEIWQYSNGRIAPERLYERVASVYGESPVVSPDGRWLVYRDVRPKENSPGASAHGETTHVSTIRLYDRVNKRDSVLVGSAISSKWRDDGKRTFSSVGRFAVSPDSKSVYVPYGGQVHRIDFLTGHDSVVPLTIEIDQCLAPLVYKKYRIGDGPLQVFNMRSATQSPDGKHVVFNALRRLYIMSLPNGRPQALLPSTTGQFYPAYSPDGKWIAFVTWSEVDGGHVWRIPVAGGAAEKLTTSPGYYGPPEWSPDGAKLAFVGSSDVGLERPGFQVNLYEGQLHVIFVPERRDSQLPITTRLGDPISFSEDGSRVFFRASESNEQLKLTSAKTDGTDIREEQPKGIESYGNSTYATTSPNGQHIAVINQGNLSLYDCSPRLRGSDGSCPAFKITKAGAYDPRWREGGAILEWSYGRTYYRARTGELLAMLHTSTNSTFSGDVVEGVQAMQIDLQVPRRRSQVEIALKGARIISMKGDEVIEKGTIIVRNGRIEQVGPWDQVDISSDAKVILLDGKTIMPGLIDSHGHMQLARDLLPKNHWELLANLAFGVTTVKDPSNGGTHGFQYSEMTETGQTVGPRIYGTVGLISSIAEVNSFADAVAVVRSMKLLGSTFVKYHTGFSRQQRQWIFEAARREGLNVATHYPTNNGATQLNLTTIYDGATTAEHDIAETQDLFDDVRQMLITSGVGVSYADAPSLSGGYQNRYWSAIEDDPRAGFLLLSPPKDRLDSSQLPAGLAPLYPSAEKSAEVLADIDRRGAKVLVGSHGNYDGIGMHWSMWAHARGGMSNLHVLRAATLNGAWGLGLQDDLGSIEAGKVADLLILDQNPLDDIRNTLTIESVMKDGILRDSMTLDEVWPMQTPLPAWRYQRPAETTTH